MRKPFYRTGRGWFVAARMRDGSLKQVHLSHDESEARQLWEEHYRPREAASHVPIGVREVEVTRTVTRTKTKTRTITKPIIQTIVKMIDVPTPATCSVETKPKANPKPGKPTKRKPENVKGRYHQFERLTLITELLTPLRRGGTIDEIYSDVCDLLGRIVSTRTVRRDLEFLAQTGVVDSDDGNRYRWCGANVRAVVMERMSEAMEQRRD